MVGSLESCLPYEKTSWAVVSLHIQHRAAAGGPCDVVLCFLARDLQIPPGAYQNLPGASRFPGSSKCT